MIVSRHLLQFYRCHSTANDSIENNFYYVERKFSVAVSRANFNLSSNYENM